MMMQPHTAVRTSRKSPLERNSVFSCPWPRERVKPQGELSCASWRFFAEHNAVSCVSDFQAQMEFLRSQGRSSDERQAKESRANLLAVGCCSLDSRWRSNALGIIRESHLPVLNV